MKIKLFLIFLLATCQQMFAQNNYYWVGGSGNWSDLNKWRIGSITGPQATIIPSRYDNVFFTSGSGFTSAGGTITISSSAICKDFTVDDSFAGKIRFVDRAVVFNIYGNLKWRGNVGGAYNLTMNLYSDSSNPVPNTIDIQSNLIDPGYVNSSYNSSINFLGTGSFNMLNDFNSNGYFSFNVGENAVLLNNNKNITVTSAINYTSSAVSDFGTAVLTSNSNNSANYNNYNASSYNANANLTQATVSAHSLIIPTTQNIKNIILRSGGISVGTLLTADNISGTEGGRLSTSNGTGSYDINTANLSGASIYYIGGGSISSNIANFKANTMILGNGNNTFYASNYSVNNLTLGSGTNTFSYDSSTAYNINNLTLNGSSCNFTNTTTRTFNVNQTLVVNPSCNGASPSFGGSGTSTANLVLPSGINGTGTANFTGYTLNKVWLTGGGSATAAKDGGGNAGNISFTAPAPKIYYRIGGGGYWADISKWSLSSGGVPANCVPTMYDDVVFDANSGFTSGNDTLSSPGVEVSVRNMTWNNAPGNPIYDINTTNIYGSLYLQKDMTAAAARFVLQKYYSTSPAANRYMSFEGQQINTLHIGSINDNFYLVPASWPAPYDVRANVFSFNSSRPLVAKLFADGTKIYIDEGSGFHMGGKSVAINNAQIWAGNLQLYTADAINAPNTSLYIRNWYYGRFNTNANANHFFGSIYKDGTLNTVFATMKTNLFQSNGSGTISLSGINTAQNVNILADNNIDIQGSGSLRATDTFVYNRSDCDLVMNFTGNGGNNLILGNNINGNGFVELNRMQISGINAVYTTPIAGAKPVNANNSIDNGNNSGINFTVPTAKNFYWKGGSGSWNDLAHWSLDPTPARVTANCGLPTIYDNVFFDEHSGFTAGSITAIRLDNNVVVNDMIFSGLVPTQRSNFSGNNSLYNISINGNLMLHQGYYDAGYFSGFYFINTGKSAGINKSVYPNGANSSFIFADNANYKLYHGTGLKDISGGSITFGGTGDLDLSNTVLDLNRGIFYGNQLLLDNSDITITGGNSNVFAQFYTQQPVISNNSILRLVGSGTFRTNTLAHYFDRIDMTGATSSGTGNYITMDAQNTVINYLNILPAAVTLATTTNPTIRLAKLEVNHLNMQQSNIVQLIENIKVNQTMLLQGGCLDGDQLRIEGWSGVKQIIIPSYNSTDFVIDNVRLQNISSSGGQTYIASNSTDLGGNVGISFSGISASASRNLYWVGGQGSWNDISHWSLSSGGTPLTGCGVPRANDNVFFDQNSGFTPTQKSILIDGLGGQQAFANNITFNNAPNSPVLQTTYNYNNGAYQTWKLNIYGNLTLQSDMRVGEYEGSYNTVYSFIQMQQSAIAGSTRYIDTKGVYTNIQMASISDSFELLSAYKGSVSSNVVNYNFKTNNFPMTVTRFYAENVSAGNTFDFGQSVITGIQTSSTGGTIYTSGYPNFTISQNGSSPVNIIADHTKIRVKNFTLNVSSPTSFGEITIWKDGVFNTQNIAHNYDKVVFLGSSTTSSTSTLSSPGNYKTLYFNPGNYTIASGQNISENLFMTGTPCNRISVSRVSASGQSIINLDPTANYTMFYASVKDMSFSRPVSAYGNSQDLGNTTNLTIVPTDVQAVGFGGNKTLCASEFPKTYDAATLFGTDPSATYTWTKIGNPNAGIISTLPTVTFTQAGNYRVSVVYAQDGCNITEDFTISSVALPIDNTTVVTSSVLQSATGDVTVTFKGSLTNQTYIFTYSINNGADMEVTSNANGVATILHPRNVAGTFVYHLKGVRFANGTACPVEISNKDIIVNINPTCSTPGVVQLYGTELRGCTISMGARRLAEVSAPVTAIVNPPITANVMKLIPGTGIVVMEGADVFLLRNKDALPEILTGLPTSKPHIEGAVIYHNDRFYEGVENGRWIRIDNE